MINIELKIWLYSHINTSNIYMLYNFKIIFNKMIFWGKTNFQVMGNHILQMKKKIWEGGFDFREIESIWSKAQHLLIC